MWVGTGPMARWRWKARIALLPAVALVGVLAGCASLHTSAPRASARLSISIDLDRLTATTGSIIKGAAVVTNNTTKTVSFESCPIPWLQVGLVAKGITFEPASTTQVCVSTYRFGPGVTRVPVIVSATYSNCTSSLACVTSGPDLPAGTYTTDAIAHGLPAGTTLPPPLKVTLTQGPAMVDNILPVAQLDDCRRAGVWVTEPASRLYALPVNALTAQLIAHRASPLFATTARAFARLNAIAKAHPERGIVLWLVKTPTRVALDTAAKDCRAFVDDLLR